MATPPNFVHADGDANNMDASLWGELQYFMDLSMIYAKFPLAPFFRLRQVCKEWNRLASDRQFLEQNFKPPFSSNPYFVLPCANGGHALLTLEGSSWSSTPVPQMRYEVSGLLYDDFKDIRVFDLHTRVFHTLPPHEEKRDSNNPLFGMMWVDTSLVPYGFRVIISDDYTSKTRVYDSNSGAWNVKLSTRLRYLYYFASLATSVIHYNNSIYFEVDYCTECQSFLIYDLEKDKWNFLKFWNPTGGRGGGNDIGIWKDRWFSFGLTDAVVLDTMARRIKFNVWECVPKNEEYSWNEFDCMPEDIHQWMRGLDYYETKFSGEHVLIYNNMGCGKKVVLYNLDRKTWEKIEMPASLML